MPRRILKASSARPAQTPLVGCADDASSLTLNTVALRLRGPHFPLPAPQIALATIAVPLI